MYLPQFYKTIKNDTWWGKGYTGMDKYMLYSGMICICWKIIVRYEDTKVFSKLLQYSSYWVIINDILQF